jgi:hypothetical protein
MRSPDYAKSWLPGRAWILLGMAWWGRPGDRLDRDLLNQTAGRARAARSENSHRTR